MTRDELLASIATTIRDYRAGEIAQPTPEHVHRWVSQFDQDVQLLILAETDHVLKQTYFNRNNVTAFLQALIGNEEITGGDPSEFWRGVKFFNKQGGGSSQREMVALVDEFLAERFGFTTKHCGENATTFVYLDDVVFTGNRVRTDVSTWIVNSAPSLVNLHVIVIAYHRGGQFYAKTKINEAATGAKKQIDVRWWRCIELEDRKNYINSSDVLRPRGLGNDPLVAAYASSLKFPPLFRTQSGRGEHEIYSSEEARNILEQELLKAGAKIRDMCPYLGKYQRPLGNMVLETLGFGSMIVSFRNCPNNAPLAFWAGDPWYPLFERKTN